MSNDHLCGVAHVDGFSCGLLFGHNELHEFTVAPPEEYFEDDVEEERGVEMAAELKVTGGPSVAVVPTTPTSKSATLTFAKPEEIEIYNLLVESAEHKDYSLSKFIVRVLTGKEEFNGSKLG